MKKSLKLVLIVIVGIAGIYFIIVQTEEVGGFLSFIMGTVFGALIASYYQKDAINIGNYQLRKRERKEKRKELNELLAQHATEKPNTRSS